MLFTTSVLKQIEVPATVSSFYVSVVYTAMLRKSIAAVVLGSFYCCPLDCDNLVMVVDCAAVETGCMLEKYIKYFSPSPLPPLSFASISNAVGAVEKGYAFFFGRGADAAIFLKIIFFFLLAALLLLLVQVLLTTSVLKQRELPATVSSFYVSVL